jgi:hypothetical protein
MRLAMGRRGTMREVQLLLLLVVVGVFFITTASGKPQQASGAAAAGTEEYDDNYDEYNPVDYEPEYEEGMCVTHLVSSQSNLRFYFLNLYYVK